jgi:hypothetical protein
LKVEVQTPGHDPMRSTPKDIATHLATLRETPVVFSNLAERLTETELRAKAEPKAWSFNEVLAHLSACAEVWGDDIEQILA